MKNIKGILGLSKRIIALVVCFTALMQGTVFAASSTYSRTASSGKKIIGEEAAVGIVCENLGIDTEEADVRSAEIVLEDGQYVYKIHLFFDKTEYFYNIRVYDGAVIKVTTPSLKSKTAAEEKTEESLNSSIDLSALEDEAEGSSEESSETTAGTGKIISRKEAIDYACEDAGLSAGDVNIKSADIVFDGGVYVYQVRFTYDGLEYIYNVRAHNGAVIKRTYGLVKK